MTLVEFVSPIRHPLWTLCKQMGIDDMIIKVDPALTGLPDPWRFETLSKIVGGLKAEGLNVVGLEGDPFGMAPIREYGSRPGMDEHRTRMDEHKTAALAHYCELLESMAKLGMKLLCYNFMVGPGWSRTGVRKVRGGALATYFSLKEEELRALGLGLRALSGSNRNPSLSSPLNVPNASRLQALGCKLASNAKTSASFSP